MERLWIEVMCYSANIMTITYIDVHKIWDLIQVNPIYTTYPIFHIYMYNLFHLPPLLLCPSLKNGMMLFNLKDRDVSGL